MAFLAYFGTIGVMAAAVIAVLWSVEPKPTPVSSRSLASASSPSVRTRVLRAESKTKPAPRVAKKAAEPADETVRELAFTPSDGEDELEQTLASADTVPLPLPAPPRPVEQTAQVQTTSEAAAHTAQVTDPPTVAAIDAPKPRKKRQVLRYVGMQDGVPTYVVVR